ncbi:C39 family peptidase [Virgibacillus kekensis]|uniref:C39 family peptidase n=1 Tax=Virgibacillus kekensis TaxID=202261 RepID=A0ABV9DJX0_9BACI
MYSKNIFLGMLVIPVILSGCGEADTELVSDASVSKKVSIEQKAEPEVLVSQHGQAAASLQTFAEEAPTASAGPLDVPLLLQMAEPQLYNGCEVTSLAMILNYHGYETTKNELAQKVPRVPLTYENGLKGNPNQGFVGDMVDGPGLTVYNGPIYDLARQYTGDRAVNLTGQPIEKVYENIAQGLPVWVITTVNYQPVNDFRTWETPSGKVQVTFSVHSVVVTGYDKDYVYLNNPYGVKNQKVHRDAFEKAWEQMGSQAIVIKHKPVS